MFSLTHTQETKKKREKALTKKKKKGFRCRKSKKDATPAAWVKLVRRAWMVSFAFRSSNSSTGQEVTTQIHTGSASNQSQEANKTRWVWKTKTSTQRILSWNKTEKKKKMHANHESKNHMQQRIMVKPAKWHVCSSVMFKKNLNGSSDLKWKFYFSWSEQKY